MSKYKPRYPIYIPSKGRYKIGYTAKCMLKYKVPFKLVIEKQEYKQYADLYGAENILVLPFADRGSVIPSRNWIKEHSISEGHKRHWQFDDNMRGFYRVYGGKRLPCDANIAISISEDFADRYENVGILGIEYLMFGRHKTKPFETNIRVYSCSLINNDIPHKWRGRYNEDADLCLQILSTGYWTTVLLNAFMVEKITTMVCKGGNTAKLYKEDGRAKMARSLERLWPGVVKVNRRFKRPQHIVADGWKKFDNPLIRRTDIDWEALKENKYDMSLNAVNNVKSPLLKKLIQEHHVKKN